MSRCLLVTLLLTNAPVAGMDAQLPADTLPCCAITSIDSRRAQVTAKEASTGHLFRFGVPDRRVLRGLKVGQRLWAEFAAGRVTLDPERGPCCTILGSAAAPGIPSQAGLMPCCSIIGIDRSTHLVSARINSNGQTFRFEVTDRALLGTLKAGDAVWANGERREAGIKADELCCKIVGTVPAGLPQQPDGKQPL